MASYCSDRVLNMVMSGFKWLLLILFGSLLGITITHYLTRVDTERPLTWLEQIDNYGKLVERRSDKSIKYIGVKKVMTSPEMDSYLMRFSALTDRYETNGNKVANQKKSDEWDKFFCTDGLKNIIGQYKNRRVKVMVPGAVYSKTGARGSATACYIN
ncbi:hypothetical protein [Yersinia entomophaga]|nr:hypothetical protein [Yersinia entomophaga]